jgi:RNA polymerase sigma-70 factor (ECF subfamily)
MSATPGYITELYDRYRRPLIAHIYRILGDGAMAEDLCQETFIRAMRALGDEPLEAPGSWLYRIATNLAYDHLRRQRRIAFTPLDAESGAGALGSPEAGAAEREAVRAALAALPARYSAPLVLHNYAGHKIDEIAAACGCPPGTVKTRLFRARRMFRAAYRA